MSWRLLAIARTTAPGLHQSRLQPQRGHHRRQHISAAAVQSLRLCLRAAILTRASRSLNKSAQRDAGR